MGRQLFVATGRGLAIAEFGAGAWQVTAHTLPERQVESVAAQNGVILAGTTDGILRSDDGGVTWTEASAGLTTRYIRMLAFHPAVPGRVFAGSEPAGIFVSHDGGTTWRACPEIEHLRDEHGWFLPYAPRAGCVRAFAFHGDRAYAAVEVGGLLRSDDQGETWRLAAGSTGVPDFATPVARTFLHPDVHFVVVATDNADAVFAATHSGFYRSDDGGQRWLHLYTNCYIRAVWIDPADPDHLVVGPGDSVSVNGQIEETRDGGWSWTLASAGMRVPWPRAVVERFAQVGDELFAVISNGQLLAAPLATRVWQRVLVNLEGINAVAAMTEAAAG